MSCTNHDTCSWKSWQTPDGRDPNPSPQVRDAQIRPSCAKMSCPGEYQLSTADSTKRRDSSYHCVASFPLQLVRHCIWEWKQVNDYTQSRCQLENDAVRTSRSPAKKALENPEKTVAERRKVWREALEFSAPCPDLLGARKSPSGSD